MKVLLETQESLSELHANKSDEITAESEDQNPIIEIGDVGRYVQMNDPNAGGTESFYRLPEDSDNVFQLTVAHQMTQNKDTDYGRGVQFGTEWDWNKFKECKNVIKKDVDYGSDLKETDDKICIGSEYHSGKENTCQVNVSPKRNHFEEKKETNRHANHNEEEKRSVSNKFLTKFDVDASEKDVKSFTQKRMFSEVCDKLKASLKEIAAKRSKSSDHNKHSIPSKQEDYNTAKVKIEDSEVSNEVMLFKKDRKSHPLEKFATGSNSMTIKSSNLSRTFVTTSELSLKEEHNGVIEKGAFGNIFVKQETCDPSDLLPSNKREINSCSNVFSYHTTCITKKEQNEETNESQARLNEKETIHGSDIFSDNTKAKSEQNEKIDKAPTCNVSLLSQNSIQKEDGSSHRTGTTETAKQETKSSQNINRISSASDNMENDGFVGMEGTSDMEEDNDDDYVGMEGTSDMEEDDDNDDEFHQGRVILDEQSRKLEWKWEYLYGEQGTFRRLKDRHTTYGLCVYDDSEAFTRCFEYVEWNCNMICIHCQKEFEDFSEYVLHMWSRSTCSKRNISDTKRKKGSTKKACLPCGRKQFIKSSLIRHMLAQQYHGDQARSFIPKPKFKDVQGTPQFSSFKPGFQCKICDNYTVLPSLRHAITHIKTKHTNENPTDITYRKVIRKKGEKRVVIQKAQFFGEGLPCYECGCRLKTKEALLSHLVAAHGDTEKEKDDSKERTYLCQQCGKSISSRQQYIRHMKTHTGSQTCEDCGRVLKNMACYLRHIRSHTDRKHKCIKCGKVFENAVNYQMHMRRHRLNEEERKFQCKFCDKAFMYKHHLDNHSVIHSVSRKFSCEECGASFKLKHHLKNHVDRACPKKKKNS